MPIIGEKVWNSTSAIRKFFLPDFSSSKIVGNGQYSEENEIFETRTSCSSEAVKN